MQIQYIKHPLFSSKIPEELQRALQARAFTPALQEKYRSNFDVLVTLAYWSEYARPIVERMLDGMHGVPIGIEYTYYDHQVRALNFMRERGRTPIVGMRGGILNLQMGLGKTLTGLTYSMMRTERLRPFLENGDVDPVRMVDVPTPTGGTRTVYPTLIVCSKSVAFEWERNANLFFGGNLKVLMMVKGRVSEMELTRSRIVQYDVVVTTYDMCLQACKRSDASRFSVVYGIEGLMTGKVIEIKHPSRVNIDRPGTSGFGILYTTPWELIIADESQRFVNPTSQTYIAMMSLYADEYWCFTGTPMKNSGTDLWAQMRFIGYTGITTKTVWEREGMRAYREDRLARVMLVMGYSDTDIVLPEKEEITVDIKFADLTENERYAYVQIRRLVREAFVESLDKKRSFARVLALFTALRQTCIAPYLLSTISKRTKAFKDPTLKSRLQSLVERGSLSEWLHDETGTAGYQSAKIKACINIVEQIPSDEKVLIFSNFTSCLDLVAKGLEERMPGYEFAHFDGDTTADERAVIIRRFKADPNLKCLLLTYRAGAEGLDLTSATRCIRVDMWWNDAVPRQAAARAWRIGQTRKVTIYNIIVSETIEMYMERVCAEKRANINAFLQEGVTAPKRLTREEIGKMIGIADYVKGKGDGDD